MIRSYLLPLLAIAGAVLGIVYVIVTNRQTPIAPPHALPAGAPFPYVVAGAGLVESRDENISVSTPEPGLVVDVLVEIGSAVKKGQPLFKLDTRALEADLQVKKSALQLAKDRLARLRALPREEEVPPAEARVSEAESLVEQAKDLLALMEAVADKRAVSKDDLIRRRFQVMVASAVVRQARTNLTLLKAGAWKPDLAIVETEVAAAEAAVHATEVDIERRTIRSPIDGQVIQRKLRPGEFATAGVVDPPLLVLGKLDDLHVRVDVDENDIWRFNPESRAEAFVRGNRAFHTPIHFVRIEPFVVPKKSLTGDSTERVDTRVMQAIYSFDRAQLPVLVGQQLDVFIEAADPAASRRTASAPATVDLGK